MVEPAFLPAGSQPFSGFGIVADARTAYDGSGRQSYEQKASLPHQRIRAAALNDSDLEILANKDMVPLRLRTEFKRPRPQVKAAPMGVPLVKPTTRSQGKMKATEPASEAEEYESTQHEEDEEVFEDEEPVPPTKAVGARVKQEPGVPSERQYTLRKATVSEPEVILDDDEEAKPIPSRKPLASSLWNRQSPYEEEDPEEEPQPRGRNLGRAQHLRVVREASSGAQSSDSNKRARTTTPSELEPEPPLDDSLEARDKPPDFWDHIAQRFIEKGQTPASSTPAATGKAKARAVSSAAAAGTYSHSSGCAIY